MTKNPVLDTLTPRVKLTLAQARALDDDPPGWMSDRQKRLLATWVLRFERAERTKQLSRNEAVRGQIGQTADVIRERIDAALAEVREIRSAAQHGRLDAADERRLAVIFRSIKEQRALVDALEQSQRRAAEVVDTDPADYQHELLDRFESARAALPVLTLAYLDGEEPDPFGGGQ